MEFLWEKAENEKEGCEIANGGWQLLAQPREQWDVYLTRSNLIKNLIKSDF